MNARAVARAAAVVALAAAGQGAWLAELFLARGWAGLAWLHGFQWASLAGAACAAAAVLVAAAPRVRAPRGRWLAGWVLLWAAGAVAFAGARAALYALFGRSAALMALAGEPDMARAFLLGHAAALLAWGLGAALAPVLVLRRVLGAPAPWWSTALFAAALALAVPLALALTWALPIQPGRPDVFEAIKSGYPVAVTVALTAAATHLATRRAVRAP